MTEYDEDVRPSFELVKSMVSCFDVCELLDIPLTSQNKIHSPWNEADMTPSCQVHEDFVYDFSTGKGGDVIDLFMALTGCNIQQAIWRLWKGGNAAGFQPGDVERNVRPVEVPDFTEELFGTAAECSWSGFHDAAMPKGVDIKRLRDNDYVLPGDGCILIPHYSPAVHGGETMAYQQVHGVKVRWFDGRKTSWSGSAFTHSLYRARVLSTNANTAWLVEGESDSWALTDALRALGRAEDVYALPSGAGTWKDHFLQTLDRYERVALVLDNDKAGNDARSKIERKLDSVERFTNHGHGAFQNVWVPQLFNDVREAVIAGWSPPAILSPVGGAA